MDVSGAFFSQWWILEHVMLAKTAGGRSRGRIGLVKQRPCCSALNNNGRPYSKMGCYTIGEVRKSRHGLSLSFPHNKTTELIQLFLYDMSAFMYVWIYYAKNWSLCALSTHFIEQAQFLARFGIQYGDRHYFSVITLIPCIWNIPAIWWSTQELYVVSVWVSEWVSEWVLHVVSEWCWVSEWLSECVSEWTLSEWVCLSEMGIQNGPSSDLTIGGKESR